jgi:hypothetical protein
MGENDSLGGTKGKCCGYRRGAMLHAAVDVAPTIQLSLSLLCQDTVTYHAQLAGLLQAPTEFMVS